MSLKQWVRVFAALLAVLLWQEALIAQRAANAYTPREDVEIGRQAAAVMERWFPLLRDEAVTRYLRLVVHRLVAGIPSELQHPEFVYSVRVIDVPEPNAHALPGGPIYLNRGLIESARTPGELAGVIAHELGHIVLRHGTAKATRVTEFTAAAFTRALLGVLAEWPGGLTSRHEPAGDATLLLRCAPEHDRQADALGLLLMARAGYDPQDMAAILQTLGRADGTWLTDGGESQRRHEAMVRDAAALRLQHPVDDQPAFERARARLHQMSRSATTEAAARSALRHTAAPSLEPGPDLIEPASSRFTTYVERNLFEVRVPSNWRELPDGNAVVFAPPGGHGQIGGQAVFTHGIEIGVAPRLGDDLRGASDALLDLLAGDNPSLRRLTDFDRSSLAGQRAVRVVASNVSDATGQEERMEIVTTLLGDGRLFYALVVAPRDTFARHEPAFRQVLSSIAIIE